LLNLDTHILVFALSGDVPDAERETLASGRWSISAIVLWGLAKLAQLGRLDLDLAAPESTSALSAVHIWPLHLDVCRTSTQLDFAGDPGDELIAATGVVHQVPLVTRDPTILASRLVPFA
jgi:PIN domain nuclease of toxin-antitoxin system